MVDHRYKRRPSRSVLCVRPTSPATAQSEAVVGLGRRAARRIPARVGARGLVLGHLCRMVQQSARGSAGPLRGSMARYPTFLATPHSWVEPRHRRGGPHRLGLGRGRRPRSCGWHDTHLISMARSVGRNSVSRAIVRTPQQEPLVRGGAGDSARRPTHRSVVARRPSERRGSAAAAGS